MPKLLDRIITAVMDSKLDSGLQWMSLKLSVDDLEAMATSGTVLSALIKDGEHSAMAREFDAHPDGQVRRYWRRFGDFLVAIPHEDLLTRIDAVSEPHRTVLAAHSKWSKELLEDARVVVQKVCAAR